MPQELKFKFDPNQSHQIEAVESVINLFNGFSQDITDFQMISDVVPNISENTDFNEDWLYGNYIEVVDRNNQIKEENGFKSDLSGGLFLEYEDGLMLSGIDNRTVRFPVFTIEMETGTGKTYVYFRTIHELKKHYGFRKFIIVVPSIAIYEGTIKAFKQTREHFRTLYGNENFHLTQYDGQQISRVRNFANSSFTEMLVMTIDSFNKASNIFYKPTEKLQGEWLPYQYIQATKSILILDESQNYRSELSRQALRTLNPLFALNYSATPVVKYNLVYRLSPVDAFRQDLVKKIRVDGVTQQHNLNDKTLSLLLETINTGSGLPTATVRAYVIINGEKTQQSIKLKKGDDLFVKTHNESFQGFVVEEINARYNKVIFTNQSELAGDGKNSISLSKKEVYRVQIEETIRYHFERQKALKEKGIKVLSLFFIDRVANYKGPEPFIKTTFEAAFNRLKQSDEYFRKFEAEDIHSGYFAQKKGEEIYIDSFDLQGVRTEAEKKKIREAEKEAFQLIMRDKEKLLSFSEKTCFIFAHSALREGWDNPNVFNICLLKEPNYNNENTRRQEIGRGLRLCVNQDGERVKEDINLLTVISPEEFAQYVNRLQQEYVETGDAPPPPPTKARRAYAKRNDKVYKSIDFRQFWAKLSQETSYKINVDSEKLVEQCITQLNIAHFPDPQIVITRGEFIMSEYSFLLIETRQDKARIRLSIADTAGNKNDYDVWCHLGYDFGRKSKDPNLKGFRVIQIDHHSTDPVVHFGNNVTLYKNRVHTHSGDPDVVEQQKSVQQARQTYPVFNLIDRAAKATGLTRPTIVRIFKGIEDQKKERIFTNPEGFASIFIQEIKEELANHIADNIEYTLSRNIQQYNLDQFFPEQKEFPQRELIDGSKHSLYDQIQTDSEVEQKFVVNRVQYDDNDGNVLCYFKFPASFKIHIPKIIGNYNPDWGIIRIAPDGKTKLQLVRETKGTMNPNLLQFSNEARKIECAKKHFKAIGISYRQVTDQIIRYWEDEVTAPIQGEILSIAAEKEVPYKKKGMSESH